MNSLIAEGNLPSALIVNEPRLEDTNTIRGNVDFLSKGTKAPVVEAAPKRLTENVSSNRARVIGVHGPWALGKSQHY